jgi:hypothetical protein
MDATEGRPQSGLKVKTRRVIGVLTFNYYETPRGVNALCARRAAGIFKFDREAARAAC